jgi:hypothetical protein
MSASPADMLAEICTMFTYGFAPMEIVYKVRVGPDQQDGSRRSRFMDGRIGWRKIALRGQETVSRWAFDDEGGIAGMYQRAPKVTSIGHTMWSEVLIPIEKLLLFRTTKNKNNPEGRSILRNAYRSWYFKKRFEDIEAMGHDRGLNGYPVFRVPGKIMEPTASPQEKAIYAAAKAVVTRIRMDQEAGLVLPSDRDDKGHLFFDFEFKGMDGRRSADVDKTIDRNNRDIAMSVLADFIMLGHENVGSFSLSQDKTSMFVMALGAWGDMIEDVFNRWAVPRLFALNGMPLENLPQIKHEEIEKVDINGLANYITALVAAGVPLLPDERLEDYLRQAADLPEPDPKRPRPKAVPLIGPNAQRQQQQVRKRTQGKMQRLLEQMQAELGGDD